MYECFEGFVLVAVCDALPIDLHEVGYRSVEDLGFDLNTAAGVVFTFLFGVALISHIH